MKISPQLLLGVAAALLIPGFASAQSSTPAWPAKPITLIVDAAPGSSNDAFARTIGKRLHETLGQPVVIDNKPSGGGIIANSLVAKAAPDGYTLVLLSTTFTTVAATRASLPYDPIRSFKPVARLATGPMLVAVAADSPYKSIQDLVSAAKAQPGKLAFASGGNGSPAHLVGESFGQASKLKMLHVPFKGPAEAVTALLGDQVSAMFATTSVAAPLVRAGKLRALAVTSPQRLPALPGVPTLAESGLGDIELREWEGLVAPAGTPRAIIEQWNQALFQVLADPALRNKLADLGMSVAQANRPEEFAQLVRQELVHWGKFVRASGLKPG